MTIFDQSLDAIYLSPIGVPAVIVGATAEPLSVRAIDKTDGIELPAGEGEVPTILPAACVRVSELIARGLTQTSSLVNATITLNQATWTVIRTLDRRTPTGPGEVYLLLRRPRNG